MISQQARQRSFHFQRWFALGLLVLTIGVDVGIFGNKAVQAGERLFRRRVVTAVPTARVRTYDPEKTLGTFGSTPYIWVRGNSTAGGGYSPGDSFGDTSMDLYGPLSAFRSVAAPVVTYTRGYNGTLVPTIGTSFSNPNHPTLSPVVYPTQANNYYGFPSSESPPWWANGGSFIDSN